MQKKPSLIEFSSRDDLRPCLFMCVGVCFFIFLLLYWVVNWFFSSLSALYLVLYWDSSVENRAFKTIFRLWAFGALLNSIVGAEFVVGIWRFSIWLESPFFLLLVAIFLGCVILWLILLCEAGFFVFFPCTDNVLMNELLWLLQVITKESLLAAQVTWGKKRSLCVLFG